MTLNFGYSAWEYTWPTKLCFTFSPWTMGSMGLFTSLKLSICFHTLLDQNVELRLIWAKIHICSIKETGTNYKPYIWRLIWASLIFRKEGWDLTESFLWFSIRGTHCLFKETIFSQLILLQLVEFKSTVFMEILCLINYCQ